MAMKKVTPKTLRAVLTVLADFADKDRADAKVICDEVNAMLDDLASRDFFGTECQLDPRGDRRE